MFKKPVAEACTSRGHCNCSKYYPGLCKMWLSLFALLPPMGEARDLKNVYSGIVVSLNTLLFKYCL